MLSSYPIRYSTACVTPYMHPPDAIAQQLPPAMDDRTTLAVNVGMQQGEQNLAA